jgi:hypothetical protein
MPIERGMDMTELTGKVVDRTIATHATIDIIGEAPTRDYSGTSFKYRPTSIDVHARNGSALDSPLSFESFKVYLIGKDDDGVGVTEQFSDGVGYRNRLADLPAWVLEVIISTGIRVPQYIVDQVKELEDDEQEHSVGQTAGEPEGRTDPEQAADSDDRPRRPAIVVVDGSDELPDTPSDVIDKD